MIILTSQLLRPVLSVMIALMAKAKSVGVIIVYKSGDITCDHYS